MFFIKKFLWEAKAVTLYEKIQVLCKKNGFEISNLGEKIGIKIAKSSISKWKHGSMPRASTIKAIADYFGVPIEYFTGEEQTAPEEREPSENEELFRIFSSLPEDQQKSIADLIRSLSKGL